MIRLPPTSQHKVGDIVESRYAWWLVDLGYAEPLNFDWNFSPAKAAKYRRIIEQDYERGIRKSKAASLPGRRNRS